MVPKAITLTLVNHSKENLQRELLQELYKPDVLEDLLKESELVVTRRKEVVGMVQALNKAEEYVPYSKLFANCVRSLTRHIFSPGLWRVSEDFGTLGSIVSHLTLLSLPSPVFLLLPPCLHANKLIIPLLVMLSSRLPPLSIAQAMDDDRVARPHSRQARVGVCPI